jgi:hypothetical protein
VLRAELGADDVEWARGRAWAFEQAMGLVWYYAASNPPLAHLGRRTLARLDLTHLGPGSGTAARASRPEAVRTSRARPWPGRGDVVGAP